MRKARVLALMVLVCTALPLLAGPNGKVTGRVTDRENGQPLPGVGVSIDGPAFLHDAHRVTRRGHGASEDFDELLDIGLSALEEMLTLGVAKKFIPDWPQDWKPGK